MDIGKRLRQLRESNGLSQGDIEHRTGLLRCYTSRVECGHTVPNLETLGKYAKALEVPFHHLFYEGDQPPKLPPRIGVRRAVKENAFTRKLRRFVGRMDERRRLQLLGLAQKMARRKGKR
ncbi:MAG: helix-turn-helix transcriptional regulator [Acidobacteria bacterium]|nr:helix-turn-helix transcriptional regulator [Acidobacteriota bacterium]